MTSSQSNRVLIIAGEASGDLHGGGLVKAFREKHLNIEFEGVGGQAMKAAGVKILSGIEGLGAVGFVELIGTLFRHLTLFFDLRRRIARGDYRAAILINYPAFNLILAGVCKQFDCPALFYIGPQIWASRSGRIHRIKKYVTKMYVVLPFEEEIYKSAGVPVAFLGHPFVDLVKPRQSLEATQDELNLKPGTPVVGLLPGSRKSEIRYLLDDMMKAAVLIKKEIADCQFLLPVADTIDESEISRRIEPYPVEVLLVPGKNYEVMQASDILILASGSATLEAALFTCPQVIIYRVNPVSYALLSWLVKIKWFGLVNIVAEEEVAPELLNEQVTPERLATEALKVLKDPTIRNTIRNRMAGVRDSLGTPGVVYRVAADMAKEMGLETNPH
ncbi:MAG: lipid-A-disaccharide synthase [Candidatus Nitronauta litoralis]|uniref:Lipid-A-disaccharide synthase n=1 Tax=Candidatus Nitronauta litoralis TaxID=2705533 RepID=A0A7T0BUL7_9BACT|nr:MAG: lipid-A-disaccharide synthase [Candidatus Nitronauta litoralis]